MTIRVLGASAGSGKTHSLSHEVSRALDPGGADHVRPDGLVAVTYTRKAQAELAARIRRVLVKAGAFDEAQRLPLAYLGTVHAVCMRIVTEFALDAGLSPELEVLPAEQATSMLRQALESAIDPLFRAAAVARSVKLQIQYDNQSRRTDWMEGVDAIMKLARSNRIAPESLPEMARRSAEGFLRLLPPPVADGDRLEARLREGLAAAGKALEASGDEHTVTTRALEKIREVERALGSDTPLPWIEWIRLAKLSPAAACQPMVAGLKAGAADYERHPGLREDIRTHITATFEAAALGLRAYSAWKEERRYIDYEDMIDWALRLIETPAIAEILKERIEFLAVDEFQDTSPIQLALFVRLNALAGRSVWVGDRKQCIFEYAGADPGLMEAVMAWVHSDGRKPEVLGSNYRSRPGLVDAVSPLFASAFAQHGYAKAEVSVVALRKDPPEFSALPPFGAWWLDVANKGDEAEAIAEGVRRLLADPSMTPVVDRESDAVRDLRAGDIAILTATNDEAMMLAGALERRGIPTALARNGLLEQPEGALVQAGLRLLLDAGDELALAEIEALTGFGGKTPERWLAERIAATTARRARGEQPLHASAALGEKPADTLAPLRERLDALSPAEAVEGILDALDAATLCARWPEPERRLDNLDSLRALAAGYEQQCAQQHEAATLAGLLRHFGECAGSYDTQHAGSDVSAVQLSTYHRAKGLEWPVVILASLDRGEKRSVFDVAPETDQSSFNPEEPLRGRWIRFWPWPFGGQRDVPLANAANSSTEGIAVAEREDRELVRLLYVGFTRARDHLVLAARIKKGAPKVQWLDQLKDEQGPLLGLPTDKESKPVQSLHIRGMKDEVPTRVWHLGAGTTPPVKLARTELHMQFARPTLSPDSAPPPPYRIAPSHVASEWSGLPQARAVGTTRLAGRALIGKAEGIGWDAIGTAVHAFMAADAPDREMGIRVEMAKRLLETADLLAALRPEDLVTASDALVAFVVSRFPSARWRREIPISAVLESPGGARRVEGVIDLLLETAGGVVVIDHKSYPGAESTWEARALEHAPQLAAYAAVLRRVEGVRLLGCFVHFTLGGGIVEIQI